MHNAPYFFLYFNASLNGDPCEEFRKMGHGLNDSSHFSKMGHGLNDGCHFRKVGHGQNDNHSFRKVGHGRNDSCHFRKVGHGPNELSSRGFSWCSTAFWSFKT